jgi:plastocyanin
MYMTPLRVLLVLLLAHVCVKAQLYQTATSPSVVDGNCNGLYGAASFQSSSTLHFVICQSNATLTSVSLSRVVDKVELVGVSPQNQQAVVSRVTSRIADLSYFTEYNTGCAYGEWINNAFPTSLNNTQVWMRNTLTNLVVAQMYQGVTTIDKSVSLIQPGYVPTTPVPVTPAPTVAATTSPPTTVAPTPTPSPSPYLLQPQTVTILVGSTAGALTYTPRIAKVYAYDTVQWVWQSTVQPHTMTFISSTGVPNDYLCNIPDASSPFDCTGTAYARTAPYNYTAVWTPAFFNSDPYNYTYECNIHSGIMTGEIHYLGLNPNYPKGVPTVTVHVGPVGAQYTYSPASVSVYVGQSVEWIWDTGTPDHTVTGGTSTSDVRDWCSLPPGQQQTISNCASFSYSTIAPYNYTHEFDLVGPYPYFCYIHTSMTGSVTVLERNPTAATNPPPTTPVPTTLPPTTVTPTTLPPTTLAPTTPVPTTLPPTTVPPTTLPPTTVAPTTLAPTTPAPTTLPPTTVPPTTLPPTTLPPTTSAPTSPPYPDPLWRIQFGVDAASASIVSYQTSGAPTMYYNAPGSAGHPTVSFNTDAFFGGSYVYKRVASDTDQYGSFHVNSYLPAAYTKSFWLYLTKPGSSQCILSNNANHYSCGDTSNAHMRMEQAYQGGGSLLLNIVYTHPLNAWTHHVHIFDPSTNTMTLWANGVKIGSGVTTTSLHTGTTVLGTEVGIYGSSYPFYGLDGSLFSPTVWDTAFTDAQVAALYASKT